MKVLRRAWRAPFTLSCDFARQNAPYVALAASKGLISTRISKGLYGRQWLITVTGRCLINESEV
jgi:hypothetical protein